MGQVAASQRPHFLTFPFHQPEPVLVAHQVECDVSNKKMQPV